MKTPDFNILKEKLDKLGENFDYQARIAADPVRFPSRYENPADREIAALISAVFAYGRVEIIGRILEKIFSVIGPSPAEFVCNWDREKSDRFEGFYHRFNNTDDIRTLLWSAGRVREKWGSLENLFLEGYKTGGENNGVKSFQAGMEFFSKTFLEIGGYSPHTYRRKYGYFFPRPSSGSACKRLCLFTRWMTRPKPVDFRVWKGVSPSHLVIPVDAHISRIARYLGFTDRTTVSWKMAGEITASLRRMDPDDPLRYDFLLCHMGISGECPGKYDREKCGKCTIKDLCVRE